VSSHPIVKKRKLNDGSAVVTAQNTGGRSAPPTFSAPTGFTFPARLPTSQTPGPSFGTSLFAPRSNFGQTLSTGQTPTRSPFGTSPFPSQPIFSQPTSSHQATGTSPFGFPSIPTQRTSPISFQPALLPQPLSSTAQPLPSLFGPSPSSQPQTFPTLGTTTPGTTSSTTQPLSPSPNTSQSISTTTSQTGPQTTLQTTQTGLLPPVQVVPTVRFRIGENGKIHYFKREDSTTQQTHSGSYVELSAPDFTVFKNAGKRYASNKLTDPQTLQSYVLHSGQFYEFDKTKQDHRGQLAADQTGLLSKHQGNQLVDRSRANRIGGDLQPFDVGHYKQAPGGSKFDVLSGKSETFGANRDHVVSGESLKRRAKAANQNETQAYNQGLTIAIPNDEMHKPHSPTFGGRQSSKDTVGGVQKKRVEHDALQPALAFHRDTTTILERTANQNHGTVHATLDLTQPENRIRQVGAYRTLFKASASMFAANPNRGFDPTANAFDLTHTPKPTEPAKIGSFTAVSSTSGQSQGTRLAQSLTQTLKDTGKTK